MYFYTDAEELLALKKENAELKKENEELKVKIKDYSLIIENLRDGITPYNPMYELKKERKDNGRGRKEN